MGNCGDFSQNNQLEIMIRGATLINIDSKGRLAIPGRYREELVERCDGRLVVTINNTSEHCLWLYPLDEWEKVEAKVVELSSYNPSHQKLKRFILGYASDLEMDKSGRILLPALLRKFAKLDKSSYLVGQGNKFEIWDEALWNEKCVQWLETAAEEEVLSEELARISL